MQTITGQWGKKGYLIKGEKDRLQKKVSHKNVKYRGFAIRRGVLEELGFDFSNSHNPYSDYKIVPKVPDKFPLKIYKREP